MNRNSTQCAFVVFGAVAFENRYHKYKVSLGNHHIIKYYQLYSIAYKHNIYKRTARFINWILISKYFPINVTAQLPSYSI